MEFADKVTKQFQENIESGTFMEQVTKQVIADRTTDKIK